MLIKPRKVRRSDRFQSRLRSQSRQRQEYAASIMSTAIVQLALAVALALAAVKSYHAVTAQAASVGILVRLALPIMFVIGALWCLRLAVKNFRSGREVWRRSKRRPALDDRGDD